MVKLRRLKIERYRNVEPCDLTFSDGLNVVLGQNGAGKTTLLNLISRVLRTNLADTSDPFAIEIELTFPGGSLSGRIATREPEPLPAGIEESGGPAAVRAARSSESAQMFVPNFALTLRVDETGDEVHFRREDTAIEVGRPQREGSAARSYPLEPFVLALSLLWLVVMYSERLPSKQDVGVFKAVQHALRFDEGLDIYRAITARADDPGSTAAGLQPIWMISSRLDKESSVAMPHGFQPSTIDLEAAVIAAAAGSTSISLPHERMKFLARTAELLGLRSAEARFELLEKTTGPRGDGLRFGNLKFWFTRKDGSIFQDHQLSYGQKRLLTFLYYLDANPAFVIADELVNGMHHRWIEECVNAIGDRQAFLTSQNPLLLDYLTFDSVEHVKSSFVVCQTELREGRERMIWRNFNDDEADMFYGAYRVGIEHVGEILRTRGLW